MKRFLGSILIACFLVLNAPKSFVHHHDQESQGGSLKIELADETQIQAHCVVCDFDLSLAAVSNPIFYRVYDQISVVSEEGRPSGIQIEFQSGIAYRGPPALI